MVIDLSMYLKVDGFLYGIGYIVWIIWLSFPEFTLKNAEIFAAIYFVTKIFVLSWTLVGCVVFERVRHACDKNVSNYVFALLTLHFVFYAINILVMRYNNAKL